jgi:hypothetical protein
VCRVEMLRATDGYFHGELNLYWTYFVSGYTSSSRTVLYQA